MFYDASDDVNKGNALRKTTVFAAVLFLLYAAVHIPFLLLVNERISPWSILPETGGAFFCLLTLLIGAIRYPRHPGDGETETEKSRFYARSFQRLLYSFAGLYCICTPMVIRLTRGRPAYIDIKPNTLLFLCVGTCWLYLLLCFKKSGVCLSAERLSEAPSVYYRRVLKNVGKLGGICAAYTALSFLIYYLTGGNPDLVDFGSMIGILLGGLTSWVSLSLAYLLFSFSERSSGRALQSGRISGITKGFLWIFAAVSLLSDAVFILLLTGNAINSPKTASLFSGLTQYTSALTLFFTGLFTVYFLAESRKKVGGALASSLSVYLLLSLFNSVSGTLSRLVLPLLAALPSQNGTTPMQAVPAIGAVNLLFVLAIAFFLLRAQWELVKAGAGRRFFPFVFALREGIAAVQILLSGILLRSIQPGIFHLFFFVLTLTEALLWTAEIRALDPPSSSPAASEL